MQKTCPQCQQVFECNMENITQCQCYGIVLNTANQYFANKNLTDCLCKTCLLALSQKQVTQ